jgi:hypothetical protein
LAAAVDRLEEGLRADQVLRQALAAELAGPRATAGLLAVLPAVGLLLAAALGADPLQVLLHTPLGLVCLVAGVGLDALGVVWTTRLVARAAVDVALLSGLLPGRSCCCCSPAGGAEVAGLVAAPEAAAGGAAVGLGRLPPRVCGAGRMFTPAGCWPAPSAGGAAELLCRMPLGPLLGEAEAVGGPRLLDRLEPQAEPRRSVPGSLADLPLVLDLLAAVPDGGAPLAARCAPVSTGGRRTAGQRLDTVVAICRRCAPSDAWAAWLAPTSTTRSPLLPGRWPARPTAERPLRLPSAAWPSRPARPPGRRENRPPVAWACSSWHPSACASCRPSCCSAWCRSWPGSPVLCWPHDVPGSPAR